MKHYLFSTQRWHSSGEGSVKDIFLCPCFDFVSLHRGLASALGLQTAMDMQEKMTARREEIDTLQIKIQQLEDTGEQLRQVRTIDLPWITIWASNSGQPLPIPLHSFFSEESASSTDAFLASPRSIAGELPPGCGAAAATSATWSRQEGEETAEGWVGGASLQRQTVQKQNQTAGGHPSQGMKVL